MKSDRLSWLFLDKKITKNDKKITIEKPLEFGKAVCYNVAELNK